VLLFCTSLFAHQSHLYSWELNMPDGNTSWFLHYATSTFLVVKAFRIWQLISVVPGTVGLFLSLSSRNCILFTFSFSHVVARNRYCRCCCFPFSSVNIVKSTANRHRYGERLILWGERRRTGSECIKHDSIACRRGIANHGLGMYGISTSVTSGMKRRTRSEALTKRCYVSTRYSSDE